MNKNGSAPELYLLTPEQYDALKRSGLLFEFYPEAKGTYKQDTMQGIFNGKTGLDTNSSRE